MSLELQMQSSAAAEQLQLGSGSVASSSSSRQRSWAAAQAGAASTGSHSSGRGSASTTGAASRSVLNEGQLPQDRLKGTIALLSSFITHSPLQPQHSTPKAQQQGPLQLLRQFLQGWWQQHAEVAEPLLKGVLSAPLIAGIVAIMIGSCPPLQVCLAQH